MNSELGAGYNWIQLIDQCVHGIQINLALLVLKNILSYNLKSLNVFGFSSVSHNVFDKSIR